MAKASITADDFGHVTLSYDLEGERVIRSFTCPDEGGYVSELTMRGVYQVCERLSSRGATLMCGNRFGLIDKIRREYRAMRAAEKRDARALARKSQ